MLLTRARELLSATGLEVLDVASVLDEPFSVGDIGTLLNGSAAQEITEALDVLADLGIVVQDGPGYRFSDAVLREAAYRWLRPSVRRRLYRRIAERAPLQPTNHAARWVEATLQFA